jgi:membrane fusion protein, heavy metal efflux system
MKAPFIFAAIALLLAACGDSKNPSAGHAHDAAGGHMTASAPEEPVKGPHRGRLLTQDNVQVEMTIFETDVPPEFHVYVTSDRKPVNPADVKLAVALKRLGGQVDRFTFVPESDYLKGTGTVHEPHSFDVQVTADYAGKQYSWTYSSYEGRTTIAADRAKAAGITTAVAGPGVIRSTLALYGSIQPDAARVRSVTARFPGPIRNVAKQVGDTVKAGETLAVIESNESLQTYALTSPIAGVITQRHANPGEAAGSEPLFVVADFGKVWAELSLFARDRPQLQVGQSVAVQSVEGGQAGSGEIVSIAPSGKPGNQNLVARVVLDNATNQWTPGLYITGTVTVAQTSAELVVPNSALQGFRDFTVVFAQVGDIYEVRMLELGESDGEMTAVLGGLEPGTVFVSGNSYLIKADIEKSGASHDH